MIRPPSSGAGEPVVMRQGARIDPVVHGQRTGSSEVFLEIPRARGRTAG